MLPCTVRLIGNVPPDAVRLVSDRPAGPTPNTETSFEPAFTANSRRPSSLRATAPCEPSPAPVPVPPRDRAGRGERAIGTSIEDGDRVARDLVRERVDGARAINAVA